MNGATPTANQHIPVLLGAAVNALNPREGGFYVDCTFGRGGHTRELLARIGDAGRVLALDRDPVAVAAGRESMRGETRLTLVQAPFRTLQHEVTAWGFAGHVDGVLFDLGLSSPQVDDPSRGFSIMRDGPLDMRMDPGLDESAADWLSRAEQNEIQGVLRRFGEERYAKRIARGICEHRADQSITTTGQLVDVVLKALPAAVRRQANRHPATRVFQALRIQVNGELDELSAALPQAWEVLSPGGRLAVISFHSLEDRIVKQAIRGDGLPAEPRGLPLTGDRSPRSGWRALGKAVRPDDDEVQANPRARSAVLRSAERVH